MHNRQQLHQALPMLPPTISVRQHHTADKASGLQDGGTPARTPLAGGRSALPLVILCGLISIICAIDRTAMSVAILPMSARYGWNQEVKGAISSCFNIGHGLTNLWGGYMAAVISPRHVLAGGVVVWSLFTALTPLAAASKALPLLLFTRAVMGLGEGVAFPTMQAIVKGWVPADRRTRALSLIYSGHQIGSIISLLLSPLIIAATGVNAMFYAYAALGFLWLTAWEPVSSSTPALAGVGIKVPAPLKFRELPWRSIIRSKPFWAILVAHSTFGVGYNLAIAWLPTYYASEYKLDVRSSSFLSILPWLVMAMTTNASGWTADALINRKVLTTTHTRKTLQAVGNLGPALCMAWLAFVPSSGHLAEAVLLLTLTLGLQGCQAAGFASNHQDISTRYASMLFGITNASASLAGSLFVYVTGIILDSTGSWRLVFLMVAAANLFSLAVYTAWGTSEQVFE